jgi:hypothetical protein
LGGGGCVSAGSFDERIDIVPRRVAGAINDIVSERREFRSECASDVTRTDNSNAVGASDVRECGERKHYREYRQFSEHFFSPESVGQIHLSDRAQEYALLWNPANASDDQLRSAAAKGIGMQRVL